MLNGEGKMILVDVYLSVQAYNELSHSEVHDSICLFLLSI